MLINCDFPVISFAHPSSAICETQKAGQRSFAYQEFRGRQTGFRRAVCEISTKAMHEIASVALALSTTSGRVAIAAARHSRAKRLARHSAKSAGQSAAIRESRRLCRGRASLDGHSRARSDQASSAVPAIASQAAPSEWPSGCSESIPMATDGGRPPTRAARSPKRPRRWHRCTTGESSPATAAVRHRPQSLFTAFTSVSQLSGGRSGFWRP
jgi:hypothetical protein